MRGGVSLAVWIGGCVQEIDPFRWGVTASDPPTALARLARRIGIDEITIDVMSGASAGGLNAVIFGAAMAAAVPVDALRATWMNIADIQKLQQPAGKRDQLSLLDGDYFR